MRLPELKSIARERGLRGCSRMRKTNLVALLQNNGIPEDRTRSPSPSPSPQRCVTFKFDDNGSCRIHVVFKGQENGRQRMVFCYALEDGYYG